MKDSEAEQDRRLFSQLVISFYDSAWQSLGKVMNLFTGKVERNLDLARNSIDMLDMLKRQTAGNLNSDETAFLDHALYQLKMNYVEELNADRDKEAAEKAKAAADDNKEQEAPAASDVRTETRAEQGDGAKKKPKSTGARRKTKPKTAGGGKKKKG